ncbi:3-keto-steroid reductase [Plakobranchus ocellatus]|uniref:3-keto-steroid reductase n=1 Tax=Plakobranchus ocellatus TaxID=259542 RepID=A0AAV4AHN7_9GAST|nr:3-keto-steroid reductase [Plakobranchus ocellatus]
MEDKLGQEKVALITGGNSGIGFALAQRLVTAYPKIRLCLACRNEDRATNAAEALKKISSLADIQIVILDTSSMHSVYTAASVIKNKYSHIDLLYLNAGMMVISGVDWKYVLTSFLSSRFIRVFATGEGALKHMDWITNDGLQAVFQTNLFGHYVLLKELDSVLGNSLCGDSSSQIIWTSSNAAQATHYSIDDIQHVKGKNPYSSSKYATDIVSVGLNARMNQQGIYSHSVCPGLVETNLVYGVLPNWFWKLLLPIILMMRLIVPSLTTSAYNGAEALVWLSSQDPKYLDPQTKFRSHVNVFGKPYVKDEKMKIDSDQAEELLLKLDKLERSLLNNVEKKQ